VSVYDVRIAVLRILEEQHEAPVVSTGTELESALVNAVLSCRVPAGGALWLTLTCYRDFLLPTSEVVITSSSQVLKSNHLYLYNAFNNTDCFKAPLQ